MTEKVNAATWSFLWKLFFLVILGWVLFLSRDIVAALLVAVVLSAAFDPIVSFLERRRFPRILGTLLVYLIAAIIVGFLLYTFIPVAITEIASLIKFSEDVVSTAPASLGVESLFDQIGAALANVNDFLFSGDESLLQIASRFLGGIFAAIAIFALSFYLTLGRDGVEKFLAAVLPRAYEEKAISIYERVRRKIGRWLMGQLFISLVVGLTTFAGLKLLGVRYSLSLGILAAIAELVPYVGPIFTGGLALIIALGDSAHLAIYVFILFLVIQQLENHILQPIVARYTTTLNAVVVLSALLIGGKVFGVVGVVLAVPLAVLVQEILEDWGAVKHSQKELITESS